MATPWAWTLMGIPEAVVGPGVLKKVNGPGVAVPITSIMFNNIQVRIFNIVRASVIYITYVTVNSVSYLILTKV